ncbi:Probable dual-specificity RNA methyltransferase RlmN [Linum grandiflorum]
MIAAASTSLFQHVCSASVATVVRPGFRSLSVASARNLSTAAAAKSVLVSQRDTRVLLGLSEPELQQLALDLGQEGYRGKQLHHLIYKRKLKEVDDFIQLPQAFRSVLQESGWRVGRSPVFQTVTAADGTVKLLIKLDDNRLVETVGIPVTDDKGSMRLTACVSSQVALCVAHFVPLEREDIQGIFTHMKLLSSRKFNPQSVLYLQVLAIEEIFKHRVTNVVFMGMGEPMLNLKAVLGAHRCLNKDVEIGQRMITISTVGVPNTIRKLATHKLQSTLAFSIHAPNQKLRETIVPSAKSYPLDAIMKDCRDYFVQTSRRVSFEYALLAGVNDKTEHAIELAELLNNWGRNYHVNLIPFNPIEGSDYQRPTNRGVQNFASTLQARKITVSIRKTRGMDASAACGQLRNQFQKSPLLTAEPDMSPPEAELAVTC